MWITKTFTTAKARDRWIELNGSKYTYYEVYIANGFALDVKRIKVINC